MEETTMISLRLFNCDRTYNLDKVETLIQQVCKKISRVPTIEKTYFPLPRMKELCEELEKEGGHFEYAVFVVHAHESRLSINEKNAGIGYARLYRALQKVTDDKVLIVIGGDDNYKDQGERYKSVLSRWARLKIFSQFTEDYINGVKSFIFSWEDNHHSLHEEALEFYLDPKKKGSQFVPRPRTPPAKDIPVKEDIKKVKQVENRRNGDTNRGQHPLGQQPLAQQPLAQQPLAQQPLAQQSLAQTSLKDQFPPENNKDRTLPPTPPGSGVEDKIKPLQVESQATNQQLQPTQPYTAQVFPGSTTPVVHILHFYSSRDSLDHMEKHVTDVFQQMRISSKPVKVDHKEDFITQHIMKYRPRYVVLVSDCDNFEDISNNDYQVKLYQEIIKETSSIGTKLVFVITKDSNYREGDLISGAVEKVFRKLNENIDRSEQPMMMSWNTTPWTCHIDELVRLLSRLCNDVPTHPQQYAKPDHPRYTGLSEYDRENRRLKYRASISNDRIVEVLKSDPPGWEPDKWKLNDLLKKQGNKRKGTLEFWEKRDKTIEGSVTSEPAKLFKIGEGFRTEKRHSILVYSYHSQQETFRIMSNFIHHLGVAELSPCQLMEPASLMSDIQSTNPDYVMFSADVDVLQELQEPTEVKDYIKKYSRRIKDTIKNHVGKGVILMLIGDNFYKKGELCSKEIKKKSEMLLKDLVRPDKVTIMTCITKLYTTHQDCMKGLLVKDTATPPPTVSLGADDKSTQQIFYRPDKGHLRFRLVIVNGQEELKWCYPDWKPDEALLNKFFNKNKKEKKATLEIWVNDDGDISSVTEDTVSRGLGEIAWNSFSSLWKKKDKENTDKKDYV